MRDRYEVIRPLGAGGMAQVFLARARGEGGFEKLVALKKVLPELARIPETRELFLREARVAPRLNHPHIVNVFDGGMRGDDLFLVLEFIDGGDLDSLIQGLSRTGGQLAPEVVATIGSQICQALSFLFGVTDDKGAPLVTAHRDISPGNILVGRNGSVKLSDFGVVRLGESKTAAGLARGKWEYFPPELGSMPHDARGDLFALGITLYQLSTLVHPFASDSPEGHFDRARTAEPQAPAGMPSGLWKIIAKSLQKRPQDRYQSPEEMSDALETFVISVGHPVTAQVLARAFGPLLPEPVSLEPIPEAAPAASTWQPDLQAPGWEFMMDPDWKPQGPTLDESGALHATEPVAVRPQPMLGLAPGQGPRASTSQAADALHAAPTRAASDVGGRPSGVELAPLADTADLHLQFDPRPHEPARPGDEPLPPEPPPVRPRRWPIPVALGAVVLAALGILGARGDLTRGLFGGTSGQAILFIDSQPGGADVYVAQQKLGITPLALKNSWPSGAPIPVTIRKAGFRPAGSTFTGGEKQDVSVTLQPER